jgi:cell division septal protein FtsQ
MPLKRLKVGDLVEGVTKAINGFKGSIVEQILTNNQPQWKVTWDNGTETTVGSRAIKKRSRTYEEIQVNIDNDPEEEARLIQIALQGPDEDIGQVSESSDDSDLDSQNYIRYLAYYNGYLRLSCILI